MFHPTLSKTGRLLFWPLIKAFEYMGNHFPVALVKCRYRFVFKKPIDLKNPGDLNEKIIWAKLFSDTSKWTELADKYKVREYVEGLGLGKYLVKLYAVWYDAKDVSFDMLPEEFIIKANNGDGKGTNLIIKKSELTDRKKAQVIKIIDEWLHRKNIGALHAEPQYKSMRPCVIAEEVLPPDEGASSLIDYKIWCFYGKAFYVRVYSDRNDSGSSANVMTYDMDWNAHPEFSIENSDYKLGGIIPRPDNFEEMIWVAEGLSKGFPELRVDLYNVHGKIYFGELTFTSQGGFMDNITPEFNRLMGGIVNINDFPIIQRC